MTITGQMDVLTVSDLNSRAKKLLESNFSPVWIEGEISNFTHHGSGHMYFALKDSKAQLGAVMFDASNRALSFTPADGLKVLARGTLTLYEARGQYQIVIQNLYPAGQGKLWLELEALKAKLSADGLFDQAQKQQLPQFPRRIGLITSATGAAVQDVINVIGRRAPQVTLVVRPTLMQGSVAAADIVLALAELHGLGDLDLIIIARGGGSLEDLWPFNEEPVARAVHAAQLPIISAVGHETDTTICDLVADLRAPTPSAAAELAVPETLAYLQYLDETVEQMKRLVTQRLARMQSNLDQLAERYAFRQPVELVRAGHEHLQQNIKVLQTLMRSSLDRNSYALELLSAQLQTLNPESILRRGYAIVQDGLTGSIITDSKLLEQEQLLKIRLHKGSAKAIVAEISKAD
ncbi:exodeoxyribonuclease VII large subunit [Candidatus Neomarinimicrobiota bacterium]